MKTLIVFLSLCWVPSMAQTMPHEAREKFLKTFNRCAESGDSYNAYLEAKLRLGLYPDDPLLAKVKDALSSRFEELASRQFGITVAYGISSSITVAARNNHEFSGQVFHLSEEYPHDWVRERYQESYMMTTAAACVEGWLVVMSKRRDGRVFPQSTWARAELDKPFEDWIEENRKKGREIKHVVVGMREILILMEDVPGWGRQRYIFTHRKMPYTWWEKRGAEGFVATSMSSGVNSNADYRYFLVMTPKGAEPRYFYPVENRSKELNTLVDMMGGGFYSSWPQDVAFEWKLKAPYPQGEVKMVSGKFAQIAEGLKVLRSPL